MLPQAARLEQVVEVMLVQLAGDVVDADGASIGVFGREGPLVFVQHMQEPYRLFACRLELPHEITQRHLSIRLFRRQHVDSLVGQAAGAPVDDRLDLALVHQLGIAYVSGDFLQAPLVVARPPTQSRLVQAAELLKQFTGGFTNGLDKPSPSARLDLMLNHALILEICENFCLADDCHLALLC